MEAFDPPFEQYYKKLFDVVKESTPKSIEKMEGFNEAKECELELPLIDLRDLNEGGIGSENCKREIAKASKEWGCFQVVNHGVSCEILEKMRIEQPRVFKKPFHDKVNGVGHHELNFPAGCYRWGTPSATCLRQVAWSEAFHVPLTEISTMDGVTGLR